MARAFDAASSQYLENATAPATAVPVTMACWFKTTATPTASIILMSLADSATTNNYHAMGIAGAVADDPVFATSVAGGTAASAVSSTGSTVDTWHHACGVFDVTTATDRTAYIDGGSAGTNTTNRAPAGIDRVSIGRLGNSTGANFFTGDIAEAAIWDTNLTAAEVAVLAKGRCPLQVRPANLIFYCPIYGTHSPEIEIVGKFDMTVTGATKSPHTRMFKAKQ